jgi:hypothetical protein
MELIAYLMLPLAWIGGICFGYVLGDWRYKKKVDKPRPLEINIAITDADAFCKINSHQLWVDLQKNIRKARSR